MGLVTFLIRDEPHSTTGVFLVYVIKFSDKQTPINLANLSPKSDESYLITPNSFPLRPFLRDEEINHSL